jgi:HEAT repeat protein
MRHANHREYIRPSFEFLILLAGGLVFLCFCSTGKRGDHKSVDALIRDLQDQDVRLRVAAAEQLRNFKDPRIVEPMIVALKDPSLRVRVSAARTLGMIKDTRAVEPLIAVLTNDTGLDVRAAAAQALGEMQDARAVGPLILAIRDIHADAAAALTKIGAPAAAPLTAALRDADRRDHAANALAGIGSPAVEPLVQVLEHEKGSTRFAAARALAEISDPRAEEALSTALKGNDLMLTVAAHRFLIRKGEEGTEALLVKALNTYGTPTMASSLLNCGNLELQAAAEQWAKKNRYPVRMLRGRQDALFWKGQPTVAPGGAGPAKKGQRASG